MILLQVACGIVCGCPHCQRLTDIMPHFASLAGQLVDLARLHFVGCNAHVN
jgi:hypothetical protein